MTAKRERPPVQAEVDALLDYWFNVDVEDAAALDRRMRRWFASTADEDRELREVFGALARDAAAGRLDGLAGEARGRLALIVLLDQLPRNLQRGASAAFAGDARALALCLEGMELGHPATLSALERVFFCMPLQHAEDPELQELAVRTFTEIAGTPAPAPLAAALRKCADYAVAHREIVLRFGRFPHRNRALGRTSTAAELEFLASGGASFGQ